jgi:hypothetical protein
MWLLSLFLMALFVIYANVYIKRQMVVKPVVSLCCGLVYAALIISDVSGIFSISGVSASLFGAILIQPLWILIPAALVAGVYLLNRRFLKINQYPEEIDRRVRKKQAAVQNFGFMSRFGYVGELMGLELKLILRHKRTRAVLFITPIFLLYGLLFYTNPAYGNSMMWLTFAGIVITGMTMLSYGNFIVAWEGRFFDGILTRDGSIFDYFRAKYYLLVSFCIINYILSAPYAFMGIRFLWIQTACCLFNIGIGACTVLWLSQYSRKRVELSQGSAFNWQGTGASQFIMMLPAMLLPMIIVSVFNLLGLADWGFGVLAIIGLLGILFHKLILRGICRRFAQAKYAQAEGFRMT